MAMSNAERQRKFRAEQEADARKWRKLMAIINASHVECDCFSVERGKEMRVMVIQTGKAWQIDFLP